MAATPLLRPLPLLLLAQMAGIVLGERLAGFHHPVWIVAGCSLLCCARQLLQRRVSLFAPLLFVCAGGYLSLQPWVALPANPAHIANYAHGQRVSVLGKVVGEPTPLYKRTRVVLAADHLISEHEQAPVEGYLQLTLGATDMDLRSGDRVSCRGRLKPILNFNNPGEFDYRRHMAFRRIHCRMWCSPERMRIVARATARDRLDQLRRSITTLIDDHADGNSAAVLKALVVGDRTSIPIELRESFNAVGVAHLLAISGLHVGMVATVAVLLFRYIFAFVPALLRRGWVFKAAALAALPLVVAYGLVAGMSPSTQRAVLMAGVVLLALVWGKRPDPVSTTALAGIVILTVSPPALFSISFQLSFAAVVFIIMGLFPAQEPKPAIDVQGWGHRLTRRAAALLWISLLAYLGTLPLTMFHFNRVSLIGVVVNLFFVPLFGLLVVPAALLGVLLSLVWPGMFGWVLQCNAVLLEVVLDAIALLAKWPHASAHTITPNLVEMGCYYALVFIIIWRLPVFLAYLKGHRNPEDRLAKGFNLPAMAVAAALILLALDVGYWHYQRRLRSDLRVTVLSVGDGSAAIVELPKGKVMLVDGGGFTDNAIFDVGRRVVAPALWRKKIRTIDVMVLSHPNSDHLNGLLFVAEHFKVGELWTNGRPHDTLGYARLQEIVARKAIASPPFRTLGRQRDFSGAQVEILWPPADFKQKSTTPVFEEPNNTSMVLKVTMGASALVFPGDIEAVAEAAIATVQGSKLKADVLVAPHHGSRSSSSAPFLEAVDPDSVVVSCAAMGRYRFPHPTVLARYQEMGLEVFSTAVNGAVRVVVNEGAVNVIPTAIRRFNTKKLNVQRSMKNKN